MPTRKKQPIKSVSALNSICDICNNASCPWRIYEKSRCAFYGMVKQTIDKVEKLENAFSTLKNLLKYELKVVGIDKYVLTIYKIVDNEKVDFFTIEIPKKDYRLLEVLDYE